MRNTGERRNPCSVHYASTDEWWRKEQKYDYLERLDFLSAPWQIVDADGDMWTPRVSGLDFETLCPLADKEAKGTGAPATAVFQMFCRGAETTRDDWVYNFDETSLTNNVKRCTAFYNLERVRWPEYIRTHRKTKVDDFVTNDDTKIKWSSALKTHLTSNVEATFDPERIRAATYRPFTKKRYYFDLIFTHRPSKWPIIFPNRQTDEKNTVICVPGPGNRMPFGAFASNLIPALDLAFEKAQCFPFYTYSEDGSNRRENVTDWALNAFRSHYRDKSITKWDIFHYTYAILHQSDYRSRYAANLKRELPRIPYASDFRAFEKAGKRLAELHLDYEKQKEYSLTRDEKPNEKLNLRVEKMRLNKDKTTLIYNDFLKLDGIPIDTYEYRLGNRSALEWVIEQYQVSTDKRSSITDDPNRDEDPEYILRLIGQVITVSLETTKLVKALPGLGLPKD